jgi:hypothetical protein
VQRLHIAERGYPVFLAPGQEESDGMAVGYPGIAIADVGGEELQETPRRLLAAGGDEGG